MHANSKKKICSKLKALIDNILSMTQTPKISLKGQKVLWEMEAIPAG